MKFAIVFFLIVVLAITILVIKSNNGASLEKNGIETIGTVTKVFSRGKLPFCKFTYIVDGINYTKKQDIAHHLKNKIINNSYLVKYDASNPENAIIKFKYKK